MMWKLNVFISNFLEVYLNENDFLQIPKYKLASEDDVKLYIQGCPKIYHPSIYWNKKIIKFNFIVELLLRYRFSLYIVIFNIWCDVQCCCGT